MTTAPARLSICVAMLALFAVACGGDDDPPPGTTGITAPVGNNTVATLDVPATPAASGSAASVDVPLPPPVATVDLPTPPVPTDASGGGSTDTVPGQVAPVSITVTVGVDSATDRVEAVALGTTVTLSVIDPTSDDEFHLHGYDLGDGVHMPAGQVETFTFVADQAGQFELESHESGDVLMVLSVA